MAVFYLLLAPINGVEVNRPNRVRSAEITYGNDLDNQDHLTREGLSQDTPV